MLQTLTFTFAYYSLTSLSTLNLWYSAGLYLIFIATYFLSFCGDIFIGFLLIAEFAVALVLYIFMLQFTFFSNQKNYWSFSYKSFSLTLVVLVLFFFVYIYFATPNKLYLLNSNESVWFLLVNWYDFYNLYFNYHLTDLLGVRELYFSESSCIFILINFIVFFYILSCIALNFAHVRFFTLLHSPWLADLNRLKLLKTTKLIRTQNYIKQQESSTGTRVLEKKVKRVKRSASKKN